MDQSEEIRGSVCLELSVHEMQHLMDMSDFILNELHHYPPSEQREAWGDLCRDILEEGERVFDELDAQSPPQQDLSHLQGIPHPPHARHSLATHTLEQSTPSRSSRWVRRDS